MTEIWEKKFKKISYSKAWRKVEEFIALFHSKHGRPQFTGVVDGTHIPIKKAAENAENSTDYINRKKRFMINVQAVADHNYCFTDILIKLPGSAYNPWIFPNSTIYKNLRSKIHSNMKRFLLKMILLCPFVYLDILLIPFFLLSSKKTSTGVRMSRSNFLDSTPLLPEWSLIVPLRDWKLFYAVFEERYILIYTIFLKSLMLVLFPIIFVRKNKSL